MESKFIDKVGSREMILNKEFEKSKNDQKVIEFAELKQEMNCNINKILKKTPEDSGLSEIINNPIKNAKNNYNHKSNNNHVSDSTFRNNNINNSLKVFENSSETNFKKKSESHMINKKRNSLNVLEQQHQPKIIEKLNTENVSLKPLPTETREKYNVKNEIAKTKQEIQKLSNTTLNENIGVKKELPYSELKKSENLSTINSQTHSDFTVNSMLSNDKSQISEQNSEKSVNNSSSTNTTILESIKQFKYLDDKLTTANTTQNSFVVMSVNQYKVVKKFQKHFACNQFNSSQKLNLSKNEKAQTLVLDLDETLIHSEEANCSKTYDKVLTITLSNNRAQRIGLKLRPNCREFLEKMSQKFELIIFTASLEDYANKVIDYLDPENKLISHRLFRQHCTSLERFFVKDQRILNRRIEDLIIIDNLIYSFALQIDNGIPINTWLHDETDRELLKLIECLKDMRTYQDTRNFVRLSLRLNCFYNYLGRINDSNYTSKIKY